MADAGSWMNEVTNRLPPASHAAVVRPNPILLTVRRLFEGTNAGSP